MTLPASGAISINSLVGEYGGSAPHSLSEYYKGGGLVANHSNNANVPTSGTISLSNFHGQSNTNPVDNTYVINGVSGTRGAMFGSAVNYGWGSTSSGYGGIAYGANGSGVDTSAAFGSNSTKRMLTGAVAASVTDAKGNTDYHIELFFGTTDNTLTSGTTGFPATAAGIQTMFSELAGNALKVGGTQYTVFPSSMPSNGMMGTQSSGPLAVSEINGYYSHRISIFSSHSSSGSTAIGSNVTSSFTGNNITIEIS